MIKKKSTSFICCLFVFSLNYTAEAQIGYLGRDHLISFEADFLPNGLRIGLPHSSFKDSGPNGQFLKYQLNLSYGKIISKHWAVLSSLSFSNAQMKPISSFMRNYRNGSTLTYNLPDTISDDNLNTPFTTLGVGVKFRKYVKVMAPIGRYYGIGIQMNFHHMKYDFSDYKYQGDPDNSGGSTILYLSSQEGENVNAISAQLTLEYGATRMISDNIMIEYGITVGLTLSSYALSSVSETGSFIDINDNGNYDFSENDTYIDQASDVLPYANQANTFALFHLAFGYIFK